MRFRKGGFTTYLSGTPWSEAFMRQYARALEGVKATNVKAQDSERGAVRTKPGSVSAMIAYYRSPDFRGLEPSTQRKRRCIIEGFATPTAICP